MNQSRFDPLARRAAWVCAVAGFVVWQFFGNAVRGYIDTGSVFWWWGVQWFDAASETQHGPLILGVAGWLWWRNLRSSAIPEQRSAGIGAAVTAMVAALALHAMGFAVQQTRVSIVALLLFIWGVLRLAGGPRWGRAAVFPLALLVFAIPMGVLDAVGFHLRLGVIATTEVIARVAGIELVRNGTQLFSPDGSYQYDVAAACSGVRSLMALLALAALVGYLGVNSWWRRAALFGLAFPLTFVGNVVRIAGIVFAGEWFGQRAGEVVHDWAGFVVFLVVLGGVQVAAGWLAEADEPDKTAPESESDSPSGYHLAVRPAVVAAVVVTLAAVATAVFVARVREWDVRGEAGLALAPDGINPVELPVFIGTEWIGQAAEVTGVEREMLPADTGYARRLYVSTRDRRHQVFVSVVLSGQDRSSIHRPELCLVGQGWSIDDQMPATFDLPEDGQLPATLLHISRQAVTRSGARHEVPALFAYWFVGRDEVTRSTWRRMVSTAWNRLRLRPDRWAYVVAQTLVLEGETEAAAMARMQEVLDGTLPLLLPPNPA